MPVRAHASTLADKWIARHGAWAPDELRRCAEDPSNSTEVKRLFEEAALAAEHTLAEKPVSERSAHSFQGRGQSS
jgi:hypothetical protein